MSDLTIFLLYILAAAAFGASRLPRYEKQGRSLLLAASALVISGILIHSHTLYTTILIGSGFNLSVVNIISLIGLELALIGLLAALEPALRGISAGLLILGAIAAGMNGLENAPSVTAALDWHVRAHVLVSIMSYGLLTVGAIVAVYAMIQERRLQSRRLTSFSSLFAPLETTEKLLFGIAAAGSSGLAIAILLGLSFVDNLFAQHLAHKAVFSILALIVFGTLLTGRFVAGWRGRRAIKMYLGGFLLLCLAYFGVRLVLEQILNRSWS